MSFTCVICAGVQLSVIEQYSSLPRITSDCKPWPSGGTLAVCKDCGIPQRLPDRRWYEEIEKIYGNYEIYALSQGAEQTIFVNDSPPLPRSRHLVDFILRDLDTRSAGTLIDIGCGNGAALANFSAALPNWSLYGAEWSDKYLHNLRRIPNFVELYTGPLSDIDRRFDLSVMIHSLEHMPDPLACLREVASLLTPNGHMFIQVPNVDTSPFDLVVADHMSFFTPRHLSYLAHRAGLSVSVLRDDFLPKEITLLASPTRADQSKPIPRRDITLTRRRIKWLIGMIEKGREAACRHALFGIFGTSISGTWMYGALREEVDFFVDEDESRICSQSDGKPIISPGDIPDGAAVFLPMMRGTAENIASRLSLRNRARWVLPPKEEGILPKIGLKEIGSAE